jgi:2-keto-3-deoxy-L-rhamnonate aldolase RhmA
MSHLGSGLASIGVNRTKRALRDGKAVFGPFVFLSDPTTVELAGLAGFDFVVIDMEHTTRSLNEVQAMVRAAEIANVTSIVRVPEPDHKLILRVLETGALGIMAPMLESAEEAALVARAVRYPPAGRRGTFSHNRPSHYGVSGTPLAQVLADADREVLSIGLIETPKGVRNIDAILGAGIEVAVVGRGDLSTLMAVPGQPRHPAVEEATNQVLAAAARRDDCWSGMAGAFGPEEIAEWGRQDCRFFLWRDDLSVLTEAWQRAVEERAAALETISSSAVHETTSGRKARTA